VKQKDIALILVIVFMSGLLSFLASRWIFARPVDKVQTAEVVDVITSEFPLPDSRYFNPNSVNPTQLIQIGSSTNPNPFGGTSQ
jgi:hypothetical protein